MVSNNHTYALYKKIKEAFELAELVKAYKISTLLQHALDHTVVEYARNAESSAAIEASLLQLESDEWPASTAILLEMKSMIDSLELINANVVNSNV